MKFMKISHRKNLNAYQHMVIISATFKMWYEHFHRAKLLHSRYLSKIYIDIKGIYILIFCCLQTTTYRQWRHLPAQIFSGSQGT